MEIVYAALKGEGVAALKGEGVAALKGGLKGEEVEVCKTEHDLDGVLESMRKKSGDEVMRML